MPQTQTAERTAEQTLKAARMLRNAMWNAGYELSFGARRRDRQQALMLESLGWILSEVLEGRLTNEDDDQLEARVLKAIDDSTAQK